ncbi:N-acetylmuramoyl-L-alanine amidase family protein [Companilactobacillus mishanensis]|uniref:N-acetylmuramoyl-L-alanine amidase n=1 Tax=Companilactobacillus mishanensis TaxID=2486008 RepID=A0A5P0ZHY2_9LACO|nr:N-acetylmuramoyl-L-alanine amidase [Companilactobacillus mishanensis]MQS45229.1 N-acetylmuramoyl-L-alanine amidase [Companilactobacillus mishanensis]MQS52673.1 N-acetylmuramoyl-L-alanine amidase [Companilactobacillus mishanensis]MQS89617.1 N-acetylmuramoyl-L-alanine amidase [Companilactobacillus mishanensis]
MFLNKKFIASLATAAALTGVGFVATTQATPQTFIQEAKADSWINNYIADNNIKPVSITYTEGTFNKWIPYENGVGKPEGVVVHETATPGATAADEVSYFNNNWPTIQTYVHAFVDDTQILNIHSADYGVWGAGPTANAKYIQVELCEVSTTDQFARSVSNDAYYVASKLIQYGLPVEYGKTVVSHDQTSKMYGETNHTDPTGYFAKWNYGMDQFVALVNTYYNQMKSGTNAGGNNTGNNGGVDNGAVGSVLVNNPSSYATPLVAFQNDGSTKKSNRGLANNSGWYTDQQKTYNGHTYYRVSTNEWVMDSYATYTAK